MFYGFDIYYIVLVLPAFLFALYAQFKVKSTFKKYSMYRNARGLTGADAAREILYSQGLYEVKVEMVPGRLTDHYDPRTKVLRLSQDVYQSTSVAALGVAAHETGHAVQHKVGYGPLVLRNNLIPIAGIGSSAGPMLAIFGIIFSWPFLANLGIILFGAAVVFYLITLPVEFNASTRAISILKSQGILGFSEVEPARKVLSAAAMTYVASAAVAIANLLRLVLITRGMSRDD
jgi:Zn-dependent membrane protease YugP